MGERTCNLQLQPDSPSSHILAPIGQGQVETVDRRGSPDQFHRVVRCVVVLFPVPDLNQGLAHVGDISRKRQSHPELDVRDEVELWVVETVCLVGAPPDQGQGADLTGKRAEHHLGPVVAGCQLGKIVRNSANVGPRFGDGVDRAVDEEGAGMSFERLHHSSQERWFVDIVIVAHRDQTTT